MKVTLLIFLFHQGGFILFADTVQWGINFSLACSNIFINILQFWSMSSSNSNPHCIWSKWATISSYAPLWYSQCKESRCEVRTRRDIHNHYDQWLTVSIMSGSSLNTKSNTEEHWLDKYLVGEQTCWLRKASWHELKNIAETDRSLPDTELSHQLISGN